MKISVIIPVYNVEKYLEKCIQSVINQTIKNLEIILVDDGSTDLSGKICDEYSKKDKRIKVIHKENGGLSDARNAGLNIESGEYIVFVDSDDYIEYNMIENLYKCIKKYNADIVCCGKYLEDEDGNIIKILNKTEEYCINGENAIKKMLLREEIDNTAWDKMYKKEVFENIRFPYGKYYEDIEPTYKAFKKSSKIAHTSTVDYHYLIRKGSIINSKFTEKQLDSLIFINNIRKDVKKEYPQYIEISDALYYLDLSSNLQKIKNSPNYEENRQIYRKLKKEYNSYIIKILTNKYITLYKKIMCICIYFNMYYLVKKIKKRIKGREI